MSVKRKNYLTNGRFYENNVSKYYGENDVILEFHHVNKAQLSWWNDTLLVKLTLIKFKAQIKQVTGEVTFVINAQSYSRMIDDWVGYSDYSLFNVIKTKVEVSNSILRCSPINIALKKSVKTRLVFIVKKLAYPRFTYAYFS